MNKEEDLVILMSWSGENYVSEYSDPHDFVYETSGDLFILDEFEGRESIGKFRVYYVDVERAMNERESIYYVLDDHSAEVAEYYEPIFESEGYDFNKLSGKPPLTIDIMLHYVEQGVMFTDQYGDIDEPFYDSMEKMFEEALKLAEQNNVLSRFQKTCEEIVSRACEGWGFKDALADTFYEFYETEIP